MEGLFKSFSWVSYNTYLYMMPAALFFTQVGKNSASLQVLLGKC